MIQLFIDARIIFEYLTNLTPEFNFFHSFKQGVRDFDKRREMAGYEYDWESETGLYHHNNR